MMPKRDTLEAIMELNQSASPEFLSQFTNDELVHYLDRLTAGPSAITAGSGCRTADATVAPSAALSM